jgi:hypothetical protein
MDGKGILNMEEIKNNVIEGEIVEEPKTVPPEDDFIRKVLEANASNPCMSCKEHGQTVYTNRKGKRAFHAKNCKKCKHCNHGKPKMIIPGRD